MLEVTAALCRHVAQDRALAEFAEQHPRLAHAISDRTDQLERELRTYAESFGHNALEKHVIAPAVSVRPEGEQT